ncbi:MAG TPA: hypothetical protein VJM49_03125, partial [Acidimicrobiales bacterium]|nr:hypothetical protein [Acidimicrobiales bacterium]
GGTLPATGPLSFDWRASDGGLAMVSSSFQTDDGTVYALSTAPGFTGIGEDPGWPRALYRLADDGTWQPTDLSGDRPAAIDMSSDGSALYAISTAPGGADTIPRLSASTDGGETWSGEDLPDVAPPSDDVVWLQDRYLSIETAGDTTLALVTTSFRVDVPASFPELGGYVEIEQSDDGLVVASYGTSPHTGGGVDAAQAETWASRSTAEGGYVLEGEPGTPPATDAPTTTEVDPGTVATDAPTTTTSVAPGGTGAGPSTTEPAPPPTIAPVPPGADVSEAPEPETRTITWDELGLSGPDDLDPTYQLLRQAGEGWEPIDSPSGLAGSALTLGTAGERFVVDGSDGTVLVSDDGTAWSTVRPPA